MRPEEQSLKVFVAGATGVLGRELVPQLVARGHEVVGMTRSASKQDLVRSLGAQPVVADALRWENINLVGNTAAVEWQWSQTERRLVRTTQPARVFLPPAAKDALEQTARVRDEVFSAPRRGRLSGNVMGHYFPPVARAAGHPEFTPHCLRHYYGTLLARASSRTRSRR